MKRFSLGRTSILPLLEKHTRCILQFVAERSNSTRRTGGESQRLERGKLTLRGWRTREQLESPPVTSQGPFRIADATAEGRCFPTTNYASVRRFRDACASSRVAHAHWHTRAHTRRYRWPTPLRIVFQYRNRKPYHYVEAPFRSARETRPREC